MSKEQEMSEQEKEQKIREFVEAYAAIDEALKPYREARADLKKNYVENGWLEKEDLSMIAKAYRLAKDKTDMDQLLDYLNVIKDKVPGD
jgi:hypothetical protein